VVEVLFKAGAHNPVIPLLEVVGSGVSVVPVQMGAIALKVGVIFGLTVIVKVVVVAHCPGSGVKVYVVVAVLFNAGAHDPVMPLLEVVGKGDKVAPEQIGAVDVNVGVTLVLTVIVKVVVVAHWPGFGVKV
jgi:hypothetical protein